MSFEPAKKIKDIESENEAHRALMCVAHNCPNRWTVDAGSGRLCSKHAWADPLDWGAITQQIHAGAFTKAHRYEEPPRVMTKDEKIGTLLKLKDLFKMPQDPKDWAYRLQERERKGEKLSEIQRKMYRGALRVRDDA